MRYGVSSARVSGNERTDRRKGEKNGGFVQIFIGREHITRTHIGTWGFCKRRDVVEREPAAADHLRHNNIVLVCRPILLRSSLDSETIRSFLSGISCKKKIIIIINRRPLLSPFKTFNEFTGTNVILSTYFSPNSPYLMTIPSGSFLASFSLRLPQLYLSIVVSVFQVVFSLVIHFLLPV